MKGLIGKGLLVAAGAGLVVAAVAAVDVAFLRPVQWLFPLMSMGLILDGTLGRQPA